jgi:transcriptional regulator with XRE-family HTH domain
MKQKTDTKTFYCSKECFTNYAKKNFKGNIDIRKHCTPNTKNLETINKIKELRSYGWSSPRIAKELGIDRNTVMKYWNPEGNIIEGSSKKGTDIVAIDNITKMINVYNSIMNCSKDLSISHETISDRLHRKESFDYKEYTIMKLSTYLETHKKIKGNLSCDK